MEEAEDRQQHNRNNSNNGSNVQTITAQISQGHNRLLLLLPLQVPSHDSRINESQPISLENAISLMSLPASRRETSHLWTRIAPFSSIKVVDTSQIKHTGDGSNDDIFWQIFDELQSQSPDKKTVNGHKLKARLVSSNKFFVGNAVLVIERMERTAKIISVSFDEYQRRW